MKLYKSEDGFELIADEMVLSGYHKEVAADEARKILTSKDGAGIAGNVSLFGEDGGLLMQSKFYPSKKEQNAVDALVYPKHHPLAGQRLGEVRKRGEAAQAVAERADA